MAAPEIELRGTISKLDVIFNYNFAVEEAAGDWTPVAVPVVVPVLEPKTYRTVATPWTAPEGDAWRAGTWVQVERTGMDLKKTRDITDKVELDAFLRAQYTSQRAGVLSDNVKDHKGEEIGWLDFGAAAGLAGWQKE